MWTILTFFLSTILVFTNAQSTCQTNRLNAVKSGTEKARGTNLGSWLVLESWMAGKPWDDNGCSKDSAAGQWLLEKCLGTKANAVMEKHWSSFITEADFAEMSKHGVNLVRIPVGWWTIYDPEGGTAKATLNYHVDPVGYTTGGLAHLDKAFEWGAKYGIGVLVGMHAAPGSQNGNDHSSPSVKGEIYWDKYDANVGQTVDSMGLYAKRYANHSALFGFALLNEPAHSNMTVLQNYYKKAYAKVREFSKNTYIVLNPLINPFESGTESHWIDFMNPPDYTKVALDLHYYSCFGGGPDQTSADGAIGYINYDRKNQIAEYASKNKKLMFIGEWSSCGHFDKAREADFTKAEVTVYNAASLGWTFWSWTDGSTGNVWSMKTALNSGWMDNFFVC